MFGDHSHLTSSTPGSLLDNLLGYAEPPPKPSPLQRLYFWRKPPPPPLTPWQKTQQTLQQNLQQNLHNLSTLYHTTLTHTHHLLSTAYHRGYPSLLQPTGLPSFPLPALPALSPTALSHPWDPPSLLSGLLLGTALTTLWLRALWPNRHLSYVWLYTRAFRRHWRAGYCVKSDLVLHRDGYCVGYSYPLRSPLWVSYIACAGSLGVELDGGEREAFVPDPEVPEGFRASPGDYLRTGYDRGHLAPAGTITFSHRSRQQTMLLTNVCLQHPELNRQGWKSLESYVRRWVLRRGKHAIAVGPLWAKRNVEKTNEIGTPHGFFFAVFCYATGEAIGFKIPNEPVTAKEVWDYVVSLDELEKKANIALFRRLPITSRPRRKQRKVVDISYWQLGEK